MLTMLATQSSVKIVLIKSGVAYAGKTTIYKSGHWHSRRLQHQHAKKNSSLANMVNGHLHRAERTTTVPFTNLSMPMSSTAPKLSLIKFIQNSRPNQFMTQNKH